MATTCGSGNDMRQGIQPCTALRRGDICKRPARVVLLTVAVKALEELPPPTLERSVSDAVAVDL